MHKFIVVSGSHRTNGHSHAVATLLAGLLHKVDDCEAEVVSIADLPFWDEGLWGTPDLSEKWGAWHEMAKKLQEADGFIIISPEYGGMVPPRLTNFLLLCSGKEVGHKPALAVGVSSARGGTYPISQLRAHGTKNNHMCWVPDHLIIRDVEDVQVSGLGVEDSYVHRYVVYCLKLLKEYATALKAVRASGAVDYGSFPYGM